MKFSQFDVVVAFIICLISIFTVSCAVWVSFKMRSRALRKPPAQQSARPWMDHPEWAGGRMEYRQGKLSALGCLWMFVLIWNGGIGLAVVLLATREGPMPPAGPLFMLGVGGVVGGVLFFAGVRALVHSWKFRATVLILHTLPGIVGDRFTAEIHAPEVLHNTDEIRVSLRCEDHYHSPGSSGSPSASRTDVLWQDKITIKAPFARRPQGVSLPVSFDIPWKCPGIGEHSGPRHSINWMLEASADLAGVDFKPVFSVPVYRIDQGNLSTSPA